MKDLKVVTPPKAEPASKAACLTVTLFETVFATAKNECDATLGDLISLGEPPHIKASKAELPLIKLATFGDKKTKSGSYRHDDNLVTLHGAELDYDAGQLSFDKAVECLNTSGISAFVTTTPSYTEQHPRLRILLPYACDYSESTDNMKEFRKATVRAAAQVLGHEPASESFTLSQSFYVGAVEGVEYKVAETVGDCIDKLVKVDGWEYIPGVDQAKPPSDTGEKEKTPGDFDTASAVEDIITGAALHIRLRSLAMSHAGQGMSAGSSIEVLRGLMSASSDKGTDRWQERFDDIPRLVDTAQAKADLEVVTQSPPLKMQNRAAMQTQLKNRPRIYGDHLIKGMVVIVAGQGGVSKSVNCLVKAVGLAIGQDLLEVAGDYVVKPRKVALVNNEDTENEIGLRLAAIYSAYNLTPEQIDLADDNLFIQSGYAEKIRFAVTADDSVVATDVVKELGDFMLEHKIEALFVDPLVSIHNANENDNNLMEKVMGVLRELAERAQVALCIISHTRKGVTADEPDASVRGAGSTVDAARGNLLLTRMTAQEAKGFVIEEGEHASYVSMTEGKFNYAPPASNRRWFHLQSVDVAVKDWESGEDVTEAVGVPKPVELMPKTADVGGWDAAKVLQKLIYGGVDSPFVLKGEMAENVGALLSGGGGSLGKTTLFSRFNGWPDVGESRRVLSINGHTWEVWTEVSGVNTKGKAFHYDLVK